MKRNQYIGTMMVVAAGLLSATSCSDFDDYNEARMDTNVTANQTLWENICSNPDLSTFKTLAQKAGYDKVLSSSHYYTVWAPLNSGFSAEQLAAYEAMDSAQLAQELLKNHIADYSYVASAPQSVRIRTLNNKAYDFSYGEGATTFDNINVKQLNIPSLNGVIHTIEGIAAYYPSLYSYLLTQTENTDSLKAYFKKYNLTYLDEKNSVVGPIVDGKQTYIDSVMVSTNSLSRRLRASLDNEDSTYTMLIPTNDAWDKAKEQVAQYYKMVEQVPYQMKNNSGKIVDAGYDVKNMAYLRDSLIRENIVSNLVFSNNSPYNEWLLGKDTPNDTLYSTTRGKYSNPSEILSHNVSTVKMSNGQAFLMDSLPFRPWEAYAGQRSYTLQKSNILSEPSGLSITYNQTFKVVNPFTKETRTYQYYYIQESGSTSPTVEVMLPNLPSNTYNMYLVCAPGYNLAGDSLDRRPTQMQLTLHYANGKGSTTTVKKLTNDGYAYNPTGKSDIFCNHPDSISNEMLVADTIFIGQQNFPVSYVGTNVGPNLQIKVPYLNNTQRKIYSRELRIMSIVMRPVDLDKYQPLKKEDDNE